ncbi:unnamed protein product [Brugia timori]|uniref:Uncharacterized protein n=1 Tax=Brugia timori TaxID=42155 RepID=A0A0R3QT49_9BILA|nr:unnamed protein product [Brugia timori]
MLKECGGLTSSKNPLHLAILISFFLLLGLCYHMLNSIE